MQLLCSASLSVQFLFVVSSNNFFLSVSARVEEMVLHSVHHLIENPYHLFLNTFIRKKMKKWYVYIFF